MSYFYLKSAVAGLMAACSVFGISASQTQANYPTRADSSDEEKVAHYTGISPSSGDINSEINPEGPAAITFTFKEGLGEYNPGTLAYAILYRDGEVISRVPNNNFQLLKYDTYYTNTWNIAFWRIPNGRASLPGEYTVVLEKGLLKVGDLPSEALELHYTVKAQDYRVNPAPGTVTSLQDIIITWPEATSVAVDDSKSEEKIRFYNMLAGEDDPEIGFEIEVVENSIMVWLNSKITTPGIYFLDFPENSIMITNGTGDDAVTTPISSSIYFKYVIENNGLIRPVWTLGETLDYVPGVITLNAPEDITFGMVNNMTANNLYPVNEDGTYGDAIARYSAKKAEDGKSMELVNINGGNIDLYLADGQYALQLGSSLFTLAGNFTFYDGGTYYFNVRNDVPRYTITPRDGQRLKVFEVAEATFPEEVELNTTKPAVITDGVTSFLGALSIKEGDNKTVVIKSFNPLAFPGNYILTTPVNTIKSAAVNDETGKVNIYEIRLPFTIVGEGEQTHLQDPEVSPEEAPNHAFAVNLTYSVNGQVNPEKIPALYKVTQTSRERMYAYEMVKVDANIVTLDTAVELYLEPGTYELIVPEGFYYTDEAFSPLFTYTYKLTEDNTGITGTSSETSVTVYNLQGICILRNAAVSRLTELPAGLYIINGRKSLIHR